MSAPNLVSPTTITGKTAVLAVTTSNQAVLSNASGSGKLLRVNSVIASNIDGVNNQTVTMKYYTGATLGGTGYSLATLVVVPAGASLVLISKDNYINLEEDKSIGILAGANSDIELVTSYEEIS